ncbi:MAG TPA: hypothetical protein VIJ99_06705 [Acidimicrobiales bacterium]
MGTVHVTGRGKWVHSNVGSFVANLPEMLGAMAVDRRCIVAIAEFADVRYVQFWVDPDGQVVSEVISNRNIGNAVALTVDDECMLRDAGWVEPHDRSPNWQFISHDVAGLMKAVIMTGSAIYEVLREEPCNGVWLQTWVVSGAPDSTTNVEREESRVFYQEALRSLEQLVEGDQ